MNNLETISALAKSRGIRLDGRDAYAIISIATSGVTPWNIGSIQIRPISLAIPKEREKIINDPIYLTPEQLKTAQEERRISCDLAKIAESCLLNGLCIAALVEPINYTLINFEQTRSASQLVLNILKQYEKQT